MATYTTNFPTWSGFESLVLAERAFLDSSTYAAFKNSIASLGSHLSVRPVSSTVTSATTLTNIYADGVIAHITGFDWGLSSQIVTRFEATNGQATLIYVGSVGAGNTGDWTSVTNSGFGYTQVNAGRIPADGRPAVVTSWSQIVPTTLGNVSSASTGTQTSSGDIQSFAYSTTTVSDSAGHSFQMTEMDYTYSGSRSLIPDQLQILYSMLAGNDVANGSTGAEELRTFAGNDILDGKTGADTMAGGTGNDTYVVDNAGDIVIELTDEGTDLIRSLVTYTLPINVENLVLSGSSAISASGNDADNRLTGNAANNTLNGNGGIDTAIFSGTRAQYTLTASGAGWMLVGIDGSDTLYGMEFAQFADQTISLGNYAPTGAITISSSVNQGQTLTAASAMSDLNGLGTISYQWQASSNGTVWSSLGAGSALTLAEAQMGKDVKVIASYTDGHGYVESVTSNIAHVTGREADLIAYSWKAHTLLNGVSIGGGSHSGTTDSTGAASLTDVAESSLPLTISRAIPPSETTATDTAVNLQDAITILKMIVGLDINGQGRALSPYQALAADFDGDGVVALADAIGVLKHVVGLSSPDPTWKFAHEADTSVPGKATLNPGAAPSIIATLAGTNPIHVGLVGYLTGDVDGSYVGPSGAGDLDVSQPGYFTALATTNSLNLSQFGIYS